MLLSLGGERATAEALGTFAMEECLESSSFVAAAARLLCPGPGPVHIKKHRSVKLQAASVSDG